MSNPPANSGSLGSFTFMLHSHIPYVLDHGISPHGTDWLSEAACETYVPLIGVCRRLIAEGISPRITLGMTPVLVEQLADESFKDELSGYFAHQIERAQADQEQFRSEGNYHMAYLARYWEDWYSAGKHDFEILCGRDIVGAFRKLQDEGHIEIVTSSATHGYSPLLSQDTTVQAHVKVGIDSYERYFGCKPRGYWLPECAYRPRYEWTIPVVVPGEKSGKPILRKGIEEFLAESGIDYFFADSHLLKGGPGTGVYADRFDALAKLWSQFETQYKPEKEAFSPYYTYVVNSSSGPLPKVSVFARDPATGIQVWSGEHGYPGDEWYLEFHKKHVGPSSKTLGLRYWRISGAKADLGAKELYDPHRADERIQSHADHFAKLIARTLTDHSPDGNGIVCSTYDTELFGHWWFEGPRFLYHVIKRLATYYSTVNRCTCGQYLDAHPNNNTVVNLPEGSWGEGGFHWIWLNDETAWAWSMIYDAERRNQELSAKYGSDERVRRMLDQLARELLLLSASDWPFLITTGGAKDYAAIRIRNHFDNFTGIEGLIRRTVEQNIAMGVGDWKNLAECEERDRLFENIRLPWFAELENPPK
jgi:1,4-alpha-glucan branching enzyme